MKWWRPKSRRAANDDLEWCRTPSCHAILDDSMHFCSQCGACHVTSDDHHSFSEFLKQRAKEAGVTEFPRWPQYYPPEPERTEPRASESAIREHRCRKCAEKLTDQDAVCPRCGAPVLPESEEESISLTIDVKALPGDHRRASGVFPKRVTPREILSELKRQKVFLGGEYEELGIIREGAKDDQIRKYPDYQNNDVVYFRRKFIGWHEFEAPYLDYIRSHYSKKQLFRDYEITLELRNTVFVGNLEGPPGKRVRVSIPGNVGREGAAQQARKLGFDAGEVGGWPTIEIPFEDGTLEVEALACEVGDRCVYVYPMMYR